MVEKSKKYEDTKKLKLIAGDRDKVIPKLCTKILLGRDTSTTMLTFALETGDGDMFPDIELQEKPVSSVIIPYKEEVSTRIAVAATRSDVWDAVADYLRFSITEMRQARARAKKNLKALSC
jgi:hypothetical protein